MILRRFARYFRHERIYDWPYHEMCAELRLNDEEVRGRRNRCTVTVDSLALRGATISASTLAVRAKPSEFVSRHCQARHDSVFTFNIRNIFLSPLFSCRRNVKYSTRTYSCELASLFCKMLRCIPTEITRKRLRRGQTSFEGSQ